MTVLAVEAHATDYTADDCEEASVQAKINLTVDGDRVRIPAGSCTWTTEVTVIDKGITLWSDGACTNCGLSSASWSGGTNITCMVANCLTLKYDLDNAGHTRVTGFRMIFTGSSNYLIFNQAWNFRVDNMRFESTVLCSLYNVGSTEFDYYPSGVYDHNLYENCRMLFRGELDRTFFDDWALDSKIGAANQDYVIYAETNTFLFTVFGNVVDHEFGARSVFRFNYVQNVYWEAHGIHEGGATGEFPGRNARSWEVYRNTFHCEAAYEGMGQCYAAMRFRGGTGMVFDNTVTGFYEFQSVLDNQRSDTDFDISFPNPPHNNGYCDGTSPWDGNDIGGWPCRDQIGRGKDSAGYLTDQVSEPAYFWNNTFGGTNLSPNIIGVAGGSEDDIVENRDYYGCHDADSQGAACVTAFDGTKGVGRGARASRPASTTNGVAYWSDDQGGDWWATGGDANDGCLDIVQSGAWVNCVYTPYTYSHPLVSDDAGGAPAAEKVMIR